ncbi:MAG: hypothetical protein AB4426_22815 [Xenococcaceae cyanobacterium]
MLVKTSHTLASMLLLLSLGAVSVAPAIAEPTNEQTQPQLSEATVDEPILLSQLLGHEEFLGEPWMNLPRGYKLGTIVGKSGNVISVVLQDGTSFDQEVAFYPSNGYHANDVVVLKEGGEYKVINTAHPMWITQLIQDYEFELSDNMRMNDLRAKYFGKPISFRTAAIWRELERNRGRVVTIPRQPFTGVGGEIPVRGMW